jgi:chaperonin GroES
MAERRPAMPFEPCLYRIKVKPDTVEEKTAGGIILPGSVKDQEKAATVTGTVISVGPSAFEGAGVLKPGNRILFAKYGGLIHREGDEDFRFLNDEDLVAVER